MQAGRSRYQLRKVFTYLRNSHDNPNILNPEELVPFKETMLDENLIQQINKFNNVKAQKQRQALLLYQAEQDRLKQLEIQKARDEKMEQFFLSKKKEL